MNWPVNRGDVLGALFVGAMVFALMLCGYQVIAMVIQERVRPECLK